MIQSYMCVLVTQSCLTLCYAMDCDLPGYSVLGIFQARIHIYLYILFQVLFLCRLLQNIE